MTAAWPAALPQYVIEQGFSESLPDQKIESQVDAGPPLTRRRFTMNVRALQCAIWCDEDQLEAFKFFYNSTLAGGVLDFTWVNPITQRMALMRFVKPAPRIRVFGSANAEVAFALLQKAEYADMRFDSTSWTWDSTELTFDEMTT